MEEHLVIQDEEFSTVAIEEKRRRHDVVSYSHFEAIRLILEWREILCLRMNSQRISSKIVFHVMTSKTS